MCLVDYAGYRLIASSLLPIGKGTLAYGSGDAGQSVFCEPFAEPLMRLAGQWLNLKPHVVPTGKVLLGPTDIECHKDKTNDKRLFVLDTARGE